MCLDVKKLEIEIADKDINVFKTLVKKGDKLFSPVFEQEYKLNKEISVLSFTGQSIDFMNNHVAFTTEAPTPLRAIHKGLHSYTTRKAAQATRDNISEFYGLDVVVAEAVIPEGTPFIRGHNFDIVSLKLIIKNT